MVDQETDVESQVMTALSGVSSAEGNRKCRRSK
jgi:hypothetical protein